MITEPRFGRLLYFLTSCLDVAIGLVGVPRVFRRTKLIIVLRLLKLQLFKPDIWNNVVWYLPRGC